MGLRRSALPIWMLALVMTSGAQALPPLADEYAPVILLAQVDQEPPLDEEEIGKDAEDFDLDDLLGEDDSEVDASVSGEYDQNDDDDFVPSQEVSADQSLKFPVDI